MYPYYPTLILSRPPVIIVLAVYLAVGAVVGSGPALAGTWNVVCITKCQCGIDHRVMMVETVAETRIDTLKGG